MIDGPVTWWHEQVISRVRSPPQPYFHKQFKRVPTIDQCFTDDPVCIEEAHHQFQLDRKVDLNIVRILRFRKVECVNWYGADDVKNKGLCDRVIEDYEAAMTNYFIRYGELSYYGTVVDALMKQKHRLLWQRRHGEVGAKRLQEQEALRAMEPKEENMFDILRGKFSRKQIPKDMW